MWWVVVLKDHWSRYLESCPGRIPAPGYLENSEFIALRLGGSSFMTDVVLRRAGRSWKWSSALATTQVGTKKSSAVYDTVLVCSDRDSYSLNLSGQRKEKEKELSQSTVILKGNANVLYCANQGAPTTHRGKTAYRVTSPSPKRGGVRIQTPHFRVQLTVPNHGRTGKDMLSDWLLNRKVNQDKAGTLNPVTLISGNTRVETRTKHEYTSLPRETNLKSLLLIGWPDPKTAARDLFPQRGGKGLDGVTNICTYASRWDWRPYGSHLRAFNWYID